MHALNAAILIRLDNSQRKKTAITWFAFSIIGVLVVAYLIDASLTLLQSNSSQILGISLFLSGALFVAVLLLFNWLAAYCLAYKFADSMHVDETHVRIITDSGTLVFPRKSISLIWNTGKVYVHNHYAIAFVILVVGVKPYISIRDNVIGLHL